MARYLGERAEKEARWTRALAEADVPLRFVWGLEDPVSGRSILEGIREELPDPDVVELDDVGHYPQIEAPKRVFEHLVLPAEVPG